MTTSSTSMTADRAVLRRDALASAIGVAAAIGLAAAAAGPPAFLGAGHAVKAGLVFGLALALVLPALAGHAPHRRFGTANRITLVRLALVALLAGLVGEPAPDPHATAWAIVGLATTAALLDAADGPLARLHGTASAFGARFDMETDALLTLVLSALVMQFDKAGAWVLLAGALRYLFVAAAALWPWLACPLAPSGRRKAVCVVQITALIVCLGPIVPPALSAALAAAALATLVASFGADVRRLARQRRLPKEIPR